MYNQNYNVNEATFQLEDRILTNYSGYNQLARFYNYCREHAAATNFYLDFANVEWFDSNLSALLLAMAYHLRERYGHTFSTDSKVIKERFDVLYRNGFMNGGAPTYDERDSTIPVRAFNIDDKDGFCEYIENALLAHRGMNEGLTPSVKEKIIDDLLEVFCNTHHHANTSAPFFVAGQYYPKSGILKFTMVDLGDGFLPRISKATNGKIDSEVDAILWALEGNSSKKALDNCPGGLGIRGMCYPEIG